MTLDHLKSEAAGRFDEKFKSLTELSCPEHGTAFITASDDCILFCDEHENEGPELELTEKSFKSFLSSELEKAYLLGRSGMREECLGAIEPCNRSCETAPFGQVCEDRTRTTIENLKP